MRYQLLLLLATSVWLPACSDSTFEGRGGLLGADKKDDSTGGSNDSASTDGGGADGASDGQDVVDPEQIAGAFLTTCDVKDAVADLLFGCSVYRDGVQIQDASFVLTDPAGAPATYPAVPAEFPEHSFTVRVERSLAKILKLNVSVGAEAVSDKTLEASVQELPPAAVPDAIGVVKGIKFFSESTFIVGKGEARIQWNTGKVTLVSTFPAGMTLDYEIKFGEDEGESNKQRGTLTLNTAAQTVGRLPGNWEHVTSLKENGFSATFAGRGLPSESIVQSPIFPISSSLLDGTSEVRLGWTEIPDPQRVYVLMALDFEVAASDSSGESESD